MKLCRPRCLRDWSLHRYIPHHLTVISTHIHTQSSLLPPPLPPPPPPPPPPPLTYFLTLGMRQWDSGLNEKWQQHLPLSLPPSLNPSLLHFSVSSFLLGCSPNTEQPAGSSLCSGAQGVWVCKCCMCVCRYIWILSGCVLILNMWLYDCANTMQGVCCSNMEAGNLSYCVFTWFLLVYVCAKCFVWDDK